MTSSGDIVWVWETTGYHFQSGAEGVFSTAEKAKDAAKRANPDIEWVQKGERWIEAGPEYDGQSYVYSVVVDAVIAIGGSS